MKIGTKVFDILKQEWGEVVQIIENKYPIIVEFNSGRNTYTTEGKIMTTDNLPRLSLTEFNYITGEGKFTPIDQEPPIEVGEMVYGYDNEGGAVCYGRLTLIYDHETLTPFKIEMLNGKSRGIKLISKTRPSWIP